MSHESPKKVSDQFSVFIFTHFKYFFISKIKSSFYRFELIIISVSFVFFFYIFSSDPAKYQKAHFLVLFTKFVVVAFSFKIVEKY